MRLQLTECDAGGAHSCITLDESVPPPPPLLTNEQLTGTPPSTVFALPTADISQDSQYAHFLQPWPRYFATSENDSTVPMAAAAGSCNSMPRPGGTRVMAFNALRCSAVPAPVFRSWLGTRVVNYRVKESNKYEFCNNSTGL